MISELTLATGFFIGASALTVGIPVIGELIATMAPPYLNVPNKKLIDLGIPFEDVEFATTDDLVLRGWFFLSPLANSPAILYAPATSRDQRSGLSLVKPFHDAGYNILLFSYRGHGISDGSRFGFTYGADESKDVDAAVDYLYYERGIQNIGAIGHSAGAVSIILSAARNEKLDAVVAAAPYPSVEEIWHNNIPGIMPGAMYEFTMSLSEKRKGFSRNHVRPRDVIDRISPRPVLLLHGCDDQRITREQAEQLYEAAGEPKEIRFVSGATHGSVRSPVMDSMVDDLIGFFHGAFSNQGEQ